MTDIERDNLIRKYRYWLIDNFDKEFNAQRSPWDLLILCIVKTEAILKEKSGGGKGAK